MAFSRLKNIFTRLNPLNSFKWERIIRMYKIYDIYFILRRFFLMHINKDSFCGGLKPSNINILFRFYRLERKSREKLDEYIYYLKNNDLEKYNDFLEYKNKVEKRTPNLKEIYTNF